MTVLVNPMNNIPANRIYVGDVYDHDEIIEKYPLAFGAKPKKNVSPIRAAMLEQFGYVSATLRDKVVLP
jgi:hypothetical protein